MKCPSCQSEKTIKNGHLSSGNQNYKCKNCGRQFVENGSDWFVSEAEKELIKKLLLEKISLAGICRVCGVSKNWILTFIKELYEKLPEHLNAEMEIPDTESYLGKRMAEEMERLTQKSENEKKTFD